VPAISHRPTSATPSAFFTITTQTTSSTGPVSLPWVTTTADNGARTLTVTVRDATGNTGSNSVPVAVGN
jgi:hypothetical protein